MNGKICGTGDIGKNFQYLVPEVSIPLDVSTFYGYSIDGLRNNIRGQIIFYKIHPAAWFRFRHKRFWRLGNLLNNVARKLRIFRSKNTLLKEIKLALEESPESFVGLHDWLSLGFITQDLLKEIVHDKFENHVDRIVICETNMRAYFCVEDFLAGEYSHALAVFGVDETFHKDCKKIVSFRRYMLKVRQSWDAS